MFFDSFVLRVNEIEWGKNIDAPHEYTIQKDIGFVQLQCVDRENIGSKLVAGMKNGN